MNRNDYDTSRLWSNLMSLIYLTLGLIILAISYFLLERNITEYINRPSFSKEKLESISKKRAKKIKSEKEENWDLIENGIHVKTGLKDDQHLKLIIGACTSCHSAKLITQNRATREGWKNMIVWMQETQGLNDLGDKEPKVLDYLSAHYAPEEVGRRVNLDIEEIEWYILSLGDSQ